jgi:hypothetical protein
MPITSIGIDLGEDHLSSGRTGRAEQGAGWQEVLPRTAVSSYSESAGSAHRP